MADTEHVLGIDRRVVARPAGSDDDMIDAARPNRVGQRPDDLGRPAEEAGGDLGLLQDLVAETHDPMVSDGEGPRPVAPPPFPGQIDIPGRLWPITGAIRPDTARIRDVIDPDVDPAAIGQTSGRNRLPTSILPIS